MKLIDFLSDIDIDEAKMCDALSDITDSILIAELRAYRERRVEDYECIKDGTPRNIYVYNDLEQDAFEISRRIEAVDMLLQEYTVAHEPFDFESVEWWDDKEGLND